MSPDQMMHCMFLKPELGLESSKLWSIRMSWEIVLTLQNELWKLPFATMYCSRLTLSLFACIERNNRSLLYIEHDVPKSYQKLLQSLMCFNRLWKSSQSLCKILTCVLYFLLLLMVTTEKLLYHIFHFAYLGRLTYILRMYNLYIIHGTLPATKLINK